MCLAPLFGQPAQRPRPCGLTREVLAALTSDPLDAVERRFAPLLLSSGLPARLGLIEQENGELRPTAALRAYLAGRRELPHLYAPFLKHVQARGPALVLDEDAERAFSWARGAWAQSAEDHQPAPLTYLVGPSGSGRTLAAQALAQARGQSLLVVRWEQVPTSLDWLVIVREARWLGASVLLRAEEEGPPLRWRAHLQCLLDHDLNLLISLARAAHMEAASCRATAWVELPKPSHAVRARLWRLYLPARRRASGLTDDALAFRFRGTGRDIAQLARQALDDAAFRGETPPQVSLDALCACAQRRSLSNLRRLGVLERPLEGGVGSVILPQAQQRLLWEVVARVRDRDRVLDAWGFGTKLQTGLGIVVLMSGPPGTGKTLSARAVASELKVPLYRVEISQVQRSS
jgi:hypothetical protein